MDNTSSNEKSTAPPATVANTVSPCENGNGGSCTGSSAGADAGKGNAAVVVVPNVPGGDPAAVGGSNANANAGLKKAGGAKGAGAGGSGTGGEKAHIVTERERRKRMKNMFSALHALIPHVPEKTDKATVVGEAIGYIKALEVTLAKLEKKKMELALARQAEAASSSVAQPHAAQGAAMSAAVVVPHGTGWQQQPQQAVVAAALGPPLVPVAAVTAGPVGFQTWSGSNVVLSVSGDDAYISVCGPRRQGVLALVLSVLDKHGVDVVAAQVGSDGDRSMFVIHTRVNGADGENPSSEDIYKLAVSEIMVWLCS